jgi:hypothetical protein
MKKTKRTDRDNMALAKAETELAQGKAVRMPLNIH